MTGDKHAGAVPDTAADAAVMGTPSLPDDHAAEPTDGAVPAVPEQAVAKRKRGGQPANRNAERHSLYAARTGHALRARRVRRLVTAMYAAMPWLDPVTDRSAVRAWADLEHKAADVSTDLEQRGLTNARGEPRRLLSEYRGLLSLQLSYSRELGMTPSARASLRADTFRGDDLASQLARARADRGSA